MNVQPLHRFGDLKLTISYYERNVEMSAIKMYSVEEAIKAQRSLRDAAGLEPEQFPLQAFVSFNRNQPMPLAASAGFVSAICT
jgi:hypothetical protein